MTSRQLYQHAQCQIQRERFVPSAPSKLFYHFEPNLVYSDSTFPEDVQRSICILLVSDLPLERLALKADAIIAVKAHACKNYSAHNPCHPSRDIGIARNPGLSAVRGSAEIVRAGTTITFELSAPLPHALAHRMELQSVINADALSRRHTPHPLLSSRKVWLRRPPVRSLPVWMLPSASGLSSTRERLAANPGPCDYKASILPLNCTSFTLACRYCFFFWVWCDTRL